MKIISIVKFQLLLILILIGYSCNNEKNKNLLTGLPDDNSRVWIGKEYWA